jgi:HAD superfamily hydrolase (TIGR01490 family)
MAISLFINPKFNQDSNCPGSALKRFSLDIGQTTVMKSAAFFDLDNTLIRGSSLIMLARGLMENGILPKRDLVRYLFHNLRFIHSKTEKLGIIEKFVPTALGLLRGRNQSEVTQLCHQIVESQIDYRLFESLQKIIAEHRLLGTPIWLVTASPLELAQPIASKLGFTGALGTLCEVENGVYTGNLLSPILHGRLKAAAVKELCITENYILDDSYAYSDSISDLPLLSSVGKPVVVNPNAELRAIATKNNWNIHISTKVAA